MAPKFFYYGILKKNCRKMTIERSFSYDFFVKLVKNDTARSFSYNFFVKLVKIDIAWSFSYNFFVKLVKNDIAWSFSYNFFVKLVKKDIAWSFSNNFFVNLPLLQQNSRSTWSVDPKIRVLKGLHCVSQSYQVEANCHNYAPYSSKMVEACCVFLLVCLCVCPSGLPCQCQ